MLVQPTQNQRQVFQALAQGHNGKELRAYCDELIRALVDVRNVTEDSEVTNKAHRLAAQILEDNLVKRLEGKVQQSHASEYE